MIALVLMLAFQASQPQFTQLAAQAEAARAKGTSDAPALYQRALKIKPDWKEGWWALGTLHYGKNQYAEGAAAFEKLAALDPTAPAFAMLGLCQYNVANYDAAVESLVRAQKLNVINDPLGQASMYTLAKIWTKKGNFEGALDILFQFAQFGKEGSAAFIQLSGTAGLWKAMFPEEVPAADRDLVFLAGRAFWEAARRNVPLARSSFEDLVAHYPTTPGVHYLYGSFELYDNPDRAVELFKEELKISPTHIGAVVSIGAEYMRRNNPVEAMPYARKSVELAPASYASHTLLGRVLLDTEDLPGALKELELARQMEPNDPQPRIALASLYTKLGRKDDAARERREFLRIQANNKKPNEK